MLLFSLKIGQQRQKFPLCHKRLATTKVIGARKEKGTSPTFFLFPENLLPSLLIKPGLIKNFANALNKTKAVFKYLCEKFPRLIEAKIKQGVFVGPQIRELLKDDTFDQCFLETAKQIILSSW